MLYRFRSVIEISIPVGAPLFMKIREGILEQCDDLPVKADVLNFDSAPRSFLADFDSPLILLAGSKESLAYLEGRIHAENKN